jgi:excisionase family DNA binding protein
MRVEFDAQDREAIALEVLMVLRPLFTHVDKRSPTTDTIFDVKGLCEYLRVTPKWVYEQTHLNAIPHYKLTGKALRFRRDEIDNWLEGLKRPATSQPTGLQRLLKERALPCKGRNTAVNN